MTQKLDTRATWTLTYSSGRTVRVLADDEDEARNAARYYKKNFETLATVEREENE